MAIYHMIRDDKDFHPVDYEEIKKTRKTKRLNLNNVIVLIKEHGIDESRIRLVEAQCSANVVGAQDTKEKQSTSGIEDAFRRMQGPVIESPVFIFDSHQRRALNHHPKDSEVATATAQTELL